MHHESKTEAENLISLWESKLKRVQTRRSALREELLNILGPAADNADSRLKRFLNRRQELLSDQHGQGFTWKSHFNWLWTIVYFFLPASWQKPQTGSKLRHVLAGDFELTQYEQELTELPSSNHQTNPLNIPRLSLADYQRSLIQQPSDADVAGFYKTYLSDRPDVPSPQQFLEHYFLARTLVTKIVSRKADIHQSCYATLKLLVLLQSKSKEELISILTTNSLYSINNLFEELYQKVLNYEIFPNLKEKFGTRSTGINQEINPYDSPLTVAEAVFKYLHPSIDPLLVQVARLACEDLLQAFYNGIMDKDTRDNIGSATISFLSNWLLPNKIGSFTISDGINLLSPMLNCDAVPSEYKYAELCAITLILNAAICGDSESVCANAARTQNIVDRNFSPMEKEWIIFRVSEGYPQFKESLLQKFGTNQNPAFEKPKAASPPESFTTSRLRHFKPQQSNSSVKSCDEHFRQSP